MRVLLVIILLAVVCLPTQSAVIDSLSNVKQELFHVKNQIRIVYKLLVEECPEEVREKRAVHDDESATYFEINESYLKTLVESLIKCRKYKNLSTKLLTTELITDQTTESTTTSAPLPSQCLSATNLTDSWRMDHDGKDLKGGGPNAWSDGRACDFRQSLQWFRFAGSAGKNIVFYKLAAITNTLIDSEIKILQK